MLISLLKGFRLIPGLPLVQLDAAMPASAIFYPPFLFIVIVVIAALALLIGLLFRRHRQQQVKQAARQAQYASRGQEHAEGSDPDHPADGVRPRNEEIKEESV